jgi:hypothetical protein
MYTLLLIIVITPPTRTIMADADADALLRQADAALQKKMAARTALIEAFAVYGVVYAPKDYYADVDKMNKCILNTPSEPLNPLGDQRAHNLEEAINHYYNCG